jgi:hypothetical protein
MGLVDQILDSILNPLWGEEVSRVDDLLGALGELKKKKAAENRSFKQDYTGGGASTRLCFGGGGGGASGGW